MRKTILLAAAVAALAACGRDTYESGGEVVDTLDSTAFDPNLDLDLTRDTVNVPTFGTQRDTIIVDKPVRTGDKAVEVRRPTIRRDSSY